MYDLGTDLGERHDRAAAELEVLRSMLANESVWFASLVRSIGNIGTR